MPSPIDFIALADKFLDRRVRLLDCQKEQMLRLHESGVSTHSLAKIFHCSRRTVQFTLDPEKQKANVKLRKAKGGSAQYYDTHTHTQAISRLRAYKKELFLPTIKTTL